MTPSKTDSRLAQSSYLSPYSRTGAPSTDSHLNGADLWAPLRARALTTLEAMGYNPKTMVEKGVQWAEDQDPFGHVNNAQFPLYMSPLLQRIMEHYDELLDPQEYDDMIHGRTIIPMPQKYEINIKRQVRYPDSLIVAGRHELAEPTRNWSTVSLFSLKQQAIVADFKGHITYVDVKSGRPIDIRTAPGNWPKVYEDSVKEAELGQARYKKWQEHRATVRAAAGASTKL